MFSEDGRGKDESPFAIVKGGTTNGRIIFIKTDEDESSIIKRKAVKKLTVQNGKFELLPSEDIRTIYVTGPAGAGKSTVCGQYIEKYRLLYPDSDFYVFSQLEEDPAFDHLDPKRIMVGENLIEDPVDLSDIPEHSIVLFDDVDSLNDKDVQKAINIIKKQILEHGRKKNIKCLVTAHLANGNDKNTARVILNEAQLWFFFPQAGSLYQIKYILKIYFGLSTKQVQKLIEIQSRWVCIRKTYPQVVLSQHEAVFVSEL